MKCVIEGIILNANSYSFDGENGKKIEGATLQILDLEKSDKGYDVKSVNCSISNYKSLSALCDEDVSGLRGSFVVDVTLYKDKAKIKLDSWNDELIKVPLE